ncbi:MAG: helix-turn-helix transcriptional regulator [Flavobacteriales bacterium]|nr:helix-turn-helix transcriptional regulator [Flavobacteriales bacterium]
MMSTEPSSTLEQDSLTYTRHAMQIALLVKKRLSETGMSKSELALRLGKSAPEISKWLSGNQNFTLRTLSKIENALGVELVRTFTREELGLPNRPLNTYRPEMVVLTSDDDHGRPVSIAEAA